MNGYDVMNISPIVPVIAIEDEKNALPLAKALSEGGVNVMEITLRTKAGLKAVEIISKEMPSMNVGTGTVCNEEDLIASKKAGAKFVFSPGISQELINSSKKHDITLIPGVATASDVMLAQNNGIYYCKLFPATIAGGIDILKAFAGPFSKMRFCPTGGVNLDNLNDFLSLKNVLCAGGTWLTPKDAITNDDFERITKLCREAINSIK